MSLNYRCFFIALSFILCAQLLLAQPLLAGAWFELLSDYKKEVPDTIYQHIFSQYENYKNNKALGIADPAIKKYSYKRE